MGGAIDLLVNGRHVSVEPAHPQTTLLDALRSCGLTSVKEGCAEGECGTCMVALVVDGPHGAEYRAVNSCLVSRARPPRMVARVVDGPHGAEYRPVNSCLMFLPMAAQHEIYTAEGLVDAAD